MKNMKRLLSQNGVFLVFGLILLIVDVTFISMLFILSVLPTLYTIIILVVLIGLTLLAFKLLACRKEVTKQRKIGVVLSVIMIVVLAVGCYYLFTTYSAFSRMSDEDKQYEDFYVVALKGGSYRNAGDRGRDGTHPSELIVYL